MKLSFYLHYAVRSLLREGQRTLLAVVCIAFGVLALVSMQLLSSMISDAFLVPPRLQRGGELTLSRDVPTSSGAYRAQLTQLQQQGYIGDFMLYAPGNALLLRTEASGRVYFISRALGVEPESFPLLGTATLRAPAGTSFEDALGRPGSAVITYDLADRMEIGVGDTFSLSGGDGAPPVRLTVGGIAEQVPDKRGSTVYYSLETARAFAGGRDIAQMAAARWGMQGDPSEHLATRGVQATPAPEKPDTDAGELFTFMLGAAGILGLLIGGIGVANTMQVILARRTREVATLKTIGYRHRDLLALFAIETTLLGLAGGVLGVAVAALLSGQFLVLLSATAPFLFEYRLDPWIVSGGLLIGVLTAIIFGLAAIIRASGVRPGVLLRDLPLHLTMKTRLASASLFALLLSLFTVLSSVILGSVLKGIGVVATGLIGLLVLGGLLGGLLFALVRLPVPGLPLLSMARRNLQYQPIRALYALVALCVGVFAIGFAAASLLNAQQRADARAVDTGGYNLLVFGSYADHDAFTALLDSQEGLVSHASYPVNVVARRTDDSLLARFRTLEGRRPGDAAWNVSLAEGSWEEAPDAVYVPARLKTQAPSLALGDTIRVTAAAHTENLRVAGFYEPRNDVQAIRPASFELLTSDRVALRLAGDPAPTHYNIAVPPGALDAVTDRLGRAFPQAVVINKAEYGSFINRTFRGLFLFVIAVAGLALVAGAVLIANAVGLAMIERRRELGVLKAIGYTSGRVLRTVQLENALLGFLGGAAGVAGVFLVIALVNARYPQANLSLTLWQALALVGISLALAVGSATAVAWPPTHARPLSVLRSE